MARRVGTGRSKRKAFPIADIIGMVGMTQAETLEYLNAVGVPCGAGSVKSWCSRIYNAPPEAAEKLWALWRAVEDEDAELPPEVPEGVRARKEVLHGVDEWYAERYGTPRIFDATRATTRPGPARPDASSGPVS